jgi:crotonobetainyl-CoA:carnitine CoA-transferase CaiB-like acyl-CoA transferase
MSVCGEEGRDPVRVPVSIVDMGTGLWAAVGILASVVARAQTGQGGLVATSLYETALAWMGVPISAYLASGTLPTKTGSANAQIAPYQAFATSDGHLMVSAGNDNLFARLCRALDREDLSDDPDYATNAGRVIHQVRLAADLSRTFAERGSAAWVAVLNDAGVPCGPIQSVDAVLADPQTTALGMIQPSPDGGPGLVALPLSFDGARTRFDTAAPPLSAGSR